MKISNKDKEIINLAIKQAEANTSGEIVPVILKQSDFYPAAHFRVAMLIGILAALVVYLKHDFEDPIVMLYAQLFGMGVGYVLAFIPFVKRIFTSKSEMSEEVYQKALQTFYENKISITKDRTGIMIYISLLERRVEVLADCGINEKVEKDYWSNLVSNLIDEIKSGNLVNGIKSSIEYCGHSLSKNFPIKSDDTNELSDELITDL